MRFFLAIAVILGLCACEAGKVSKERQHLYDYKNNQEYCDQNPDRCVNNVPW